MDSVIKSFEQVLFHALYEVMDEAVKADAANHTPETAELREAA